MGVVTGFRGRRDGYQVPIALAEGGILDGFVTDLWVGCPERALAQLLPQRRAEKLLTRHDGRLDGQPVKSKRLLALREAMAMALGSSPNDVYDRYDAHYGDAIARMARRRRSDLLCYSAYAPKAFAAKYDHRPRRILFQYHPHFELEKRLLTNDARAAEREGVIVSASQFDSGMAPNSSRLESDDAWKLADHVICASSFTKRSLVEAGAEAERISIVPYGIDLPSVSDTSRSEHFHALFVGSGLRRKGLQHLLAAWRIADLAPGARLTIVARVIEPELLAMLSKDPAIDYRPGVSNAELAELYATASLFVMPSLVEGFGQVYLEALATGTPVLGTSNSCLPDIGSEADGVFTVASGDVTALAEMIGRLSRTVKVDAALHSIARATAARFSWATFRAGIVGVIANVG